MRQLHMCAYVYMYTYYGLGFTTVEVRATNFGRPFVREDDDVYLRIGSISEFIFLSSDCREGDLFEIWFRNPFMCLLHGKNRSGFAQFF